MADSREGPQRELTWRQEQGLAQARQCGQCGHTCQGAHWRRAPQPRGRECKTALEPRRTGWAPGLLPPVRLCLTYDPSGGTGGSSLPRPPPWEGLSSIQNSAPRGSVAGQGRCQATDPSAPAPQDLVSKLLQLHFTDSKTKGSWAPAGGQGQSTAAPGGWGGRGLGEGREPPV